MSGGGWVGLHSPAGWVCEYESARRPGCRVGVSQVPGAFVDGVVVDGAQQHQVVEVCGAVLEPVDDMVGVAPRLGPVAPGEHTAAVSHDESSSLGEADGTGASTLVKDLTDATNDRWDDPGVTRQATYCGRGERDAVGGLTAPRPGDLASEHVVVDNHLEVDLGRPR